MTVQFGSSAERHPFRFRSSSLGVYLLFALSSLRESLSCSLRLPPLPLHGYPLRITPPLSRSFDSPLATPAHNEQRNHRNEGVRNLDLRHLYVNVHNWLIHYQSLMPI